MWRNYEELEENLSLAELNQTLESYREAKREERRFLAAIQGIDIDKGQKGELPTFDDIKKRAAAKARGVTEEEYDLAEIGIGVEEWEDELE